MAKKKMEIHQEKYLNSILYFIKYCNNEYLGNTKLNKLLYYLDFISYRDRDKSVTGDQYIHNQYGPVPEMMDLMLANLHQNGYVKVERLPYRDNGIFKFELVNEPDQTVFDAYEKKILSKIAKEFFLWSTDKIVGQTHLEAPWFYSKPYEKVDFAYSKDIEFFQNKTDDVEI